METCLVCCNDFSPQLPQVDCQYCDSTACQACYMQYILTEQRAVCMNKAKVNNQHVCQKEWTREYVVDHFPKSFVDNQWTDMMSNRYMDEQKAILPTTMLQVNQAIENDFMRVQWYCCLMLMNQMESHKTLMKELSSKLFQPVVRSHVNLLVSKMFNCVLKFLTNAKHCLTINAASHKPAHLDKLIGNVDSLFTIFPAVNTVNTVGTVNTVVTVGNTVVNTLKTQYINNVKTLQRINLDDLQCYIAAMTHQKYTWNQHKHTRSIVHLESNWYDQLLEVNSLMTNFLNYP